MIKFSRVFWRFAKPERKLLFFGVVTHVIKNSPVWVTPLLTAKIIDNLMSPQPALSKLWWYGGIVAACLIQNPLVDRVHIWCVSRASRNIERNLREQICRRTGEMSPVQFGRYGAGILQSRALKDVDTIERYIREIFHTVMTSLGNLTFALCITAFTIPSFLMALFVCVPATFAVIAFFQTRMRAMNEIVRVNSEKVSQRMTEFFRMLPLIRAHGLNVQMQDRVESTLKDTQVSSQRLDTASSTFGAINWALFNFVSLGFLLFSSWAYITHFTPITMGQIVMLTGYFMLLLNAILGLFNMLPLTYQAMNALEAVAEVLDVPTEAEGTVCVDGVSRIEFSHVRYTYSNGAQGGLRDFSLTAQAGKTIALVGPSGAGKSTFLNLALGILRPESGTIEIDGVPLHSLSPSSYRRHIAVVPQDSILLDDTVFHNITFGHPASEVEVEAALRKACALDFVRRLPQGLHTKLSENGSNLSGGEKQRLAIARALLRNPKVLILDEATSALDTINESVVQQSLTIPNCIVFIVAHRLSTVRNADLIVVLSEGRMVAFGSHDELLEQPASYYAQALSVHDSRVVA